MSVFAIKAEVRSPGAKSFAFKDEKTMYGGKRIARGDTVFISPAKTSISAEAEAFLRRFF